MITTGQGPRIAYEHYFSGIGRALGLKCEVESRHILDPLTWDEIREHLAAEGRPVLGAHVHVPGATGNRLGEGWDHVYVDLEWAYGYFQRAIDELEAAGAGSIVLCCGTEFAADQFRAGVPLIAPCASVMQVVARAAASREKLRLGLMSSIGHAAQDVALWQQQPFADRLEVVYEGFEGNLMPAAERLAKTRHDLVVVWSFGLGTAESDIDRMPEALENLFGCPVIMPHRLAALTALAVLPAGFDDKAMALPRA
nr:AroM family protein [Rhizobium halophytocola]